MDYKSKHQLPENTPGQRIRKLRLTAGISQAQLSRQLGFTANYFGQVERDAKELSKNLANAICSYFNVTYSYLYHGIESAQIQETPKYYYDHHALLADYIRGCSEEECRLLEPIIKALIETLRRVRWFSRETGRYRH